MKVLIGYGSDWLFIVIYANPNLELKNILWRELEDLVLSITNSWLLAGYFNGIHYLSEKKGGALFN